MTDQGSGSCVACLEPIRIGARVCPHCRSPQVRGRWQALGTTLKWVAGTATVISLIIGVSSVKALFREWRERAETVRELVGAARMLDEAGDFPRGWGLICEAVEVDPTSRVARDTQCDLAMHWLDDIRAVQERTFTSITDELIPVLYRGAASADDERAGDLLAHLGWAYALRERDLALGGPVEVHYRQALERDPDNVFAHAYWGHWILNGWPEHLDDARQHFREALESGRDRPFVRKWQVVSHLFPLETARDPARRPPIYDEILRDLIRVADEMRRGSEPRPSDDLGERVLWCYGSAMESLEALDGVVPPEDHLATVEWLVPRPGPEDQFTGLGHRRELLVALLLERAGEREDALARLQALYEGAGALATQSVIDAAIERLTGEPTRRALERQARRFIDDPLPAGQDPWAFHAETLDRFDPRTGPPNLHQALDYFQDGMASGELDERADEALELFEASRKRVKAVIDECEAGRRAYGFTAGYSITSAQLARMNLYELWEAMGGVALGAPRLDKAVVEYEDLLRQLVPVEAIGLEEDDLKPLRSRAHYNLACAYSLRSRTAPEPALAQADMAAALASLRSAVDQGFDDWELLKADSDLEGIRGEQGYAELVRGR